MYDTPEKRWAAVQSRDPAADSAFVYAVVTTHIYCRPTCPSRLARRANVDFFNTPADAVAASYRPCKRCKPDEMTIVSRASQLVKAAQSHIRDQKGEVTLDQLAEHLNISPRYLHHIFSKSVGCTPAAYATNFKTKPPQTLLVAPDARSMSATSSSLSPALGAGYVEGTYIQPQSESSTGTIPSPWSDLESADILAPALTQEELDMLWQTYDPSFDLLDQSRLWTSTDFENILYDPS